MPNSCNFKVFFASKNIDLDSAQEQITIYLNKYLLQQNKKSKLLNYFFSNKSNLKGIYLWGGVGSGKTILLDRLFDLLPSNKKIKLHFHEFMKYVHGLIFEVRQLKSLENVIEKAAKQIAKKYDYIYLDELEIHDSTDAMVVGRLFKEILKLNSHFIISSNRAPNELYKKGLNRQFFLKFIKTLEDNTEVIHILSSIDYRYLYSNEFKASYSPLTLENLASMERQFLKITNNQITQRKEYFIGNRVITCNKSYQKVAWFEFDELFLQPYSNSDYMLFINDFDIIFINQIPKINAEDRNLIKKFINFIDLSYNKKIILVWSSSLPLKDIYTKGEEIFEFERTLSRLTEMQTTNYIGNRI